MEIVTSLPSMNGANGGTKKHVEEWSRLDRLTGMLEHARVEADHWASTTSNSRHHFGKVVDSRARNLADGSVQQQQQMKQLEVFQAHIPGGSVQVIRSHTSTTSSWHNSKVLQSHSSGWPSNSTNNLLNHHISKMEAQIDDLKFAHNSVNLNSEKAKVNVARHLSNRRPPTRSKISKFNHELDNLFSDSSSCFEIPEENKLTINPQNSAPVSPFKSFSAEGDVHATVINQRNHEKLEKKKSVSDENLSVVNLEKVYDEKENSDPWRRTSKSRWSFQYPSRSKKKEDNCSENPASNKSELENVLQKVLRRKGDFEEYSKAATSVEETSQSTAPWRRKSFVTEETLKETKQKLRHLNALNICERIEKEETDDGIFTESKGNSDKEDEKIGNHEYINSGVNENHLTTSLESNTINKTDDWFDRRKSYGFEPVHGQQRNIANLSLKSASKTNLSTDSGICRSSELELVSTPIIKKLSEANEERAKISNEDEVKFREPIPKSDVTELLQKFEKFEKPRIGSTVVTLMEEPKIKILDSFDYPRDSIKKGKVLEAIKSLKKNAVNNNAFETTPSIKTNSYFLEQSNNQSKIPFTADQELLSKRHSIACDDTKYMIPKLSVPNHTLPEKATTKSTIIKVNNFESGDISGVANSENDIKKTKKVEFSKTEVHFAAAEPGKIKIVETDEKPPPTMLYRRKKRSVSVSPKVGLPHTKFGDYEKSLLEDKTLDKLDDDVSKINLSSINAIRNDSEKETESTYDYKSDSCIDSKYTSTTSDNGLAVRICSMKPNDYRRASWSVPENTLPISMEKSGYSTKINFDEDGVTIVADIKTHQYDHKSVDDLTETKETTCGFDASKNGENIQEKLIVRIGGSGSCATQDKYVQKPTFTNSFRNSICAVKSTSIAKLTDKTDDNLKSTSLIIDTIKKTTKINDEMERTINGLKNGKLKSCLVEQPSTYLTEMNKLQQKFRTKQMHSSIGKVIREENTKNRLYNTIPGTKNGYIRSKIQANDLPSVLSAFDNLCKTFDKAIDEKNNKEILQTQQRFDILEKFSSDSELIDKRSSQLRFLCRVASQNDGNLSDDSLKADEEVRSYMSTAIMEEYENELAGSWSRKRYFKHIKPVKIVGQEEISEKSHFKPLKNEEEKFKTIANVTTDVKKPKITSVSMKLNDNSWTDKKFLNLNSIKKSTTVLLNDTSNESSFVGQISEKNRILQSSLKQTHSQSSSPLKVYGFTESSQARRNVEIYKSEEKPVKIIYHNIKMTDKTKEPDEKSERENSKHKKLYSKESTTHCGGSVRRKSNHVCDKEKLFNTGRDGWLNLPKDCKSTEKKSNELKTDITKRSNIDYHKKDKRNINGCGDISSEDDLSKRNKRSYKPLTTIEEKSNNLKSCNKDKSERTIPNKKIPATRTTSNSSIESRSNAFEFRNPILKTEERSKRRAARMLQRASSREMLMKYNVASSSDDVTSENEIITRSNKPRTTRKLKSSPKNGKPTTTSAAPCYNHNRIVTNTAKMEINIFNMKEKPSDKKNGIHISSKNYTHADTNRTLNSRSQTSQREISANSSAKSKNSKPVIPNHSRESKRLSSTVAKGNRPVR